MRLMILDGNSVINRAFYGVRLLSTKDGLFTNAVYGFLNILSSLQTEVKPDAVCVAFDRKAKTFRHLRYEAYKGTRKPMPEELAQQLPLMREVLDAMRIPYYEMDGWEADDILGTAARICAQSGWECLIVTGDRDSLQLVEPGVTVKLVTTRSGQTTSVDYTPERFEEEYGFAPKRLVDLKALMGDSSDNIPGVPGVGEKTGKELIRSFGSLDGVYANLEQESLRPAVRKKLEEGKESAYLSYELATIRTDAPVAFTPQDNLVQDPDRQRLYELFLKLEFVRLIDRYQLRKPAPAAAVKTEVTLSDRLPDPGVPCALIFSEDGTRAAVAWDGGTAELDIQEHLPELKAFLSNGTQKCCWDAKELHHLAQKWNTEASGFDFDALVAAYVLDPSAAEYSLRKLSAAYLQQQPDDTPAAQASALFALREPMMKRMEEQSLMRVYTEIDLPLCPVLARMERAGVLVDRPALIAFGEMLQERIEQTQEMIYTLAGGEFNILSPKQLGEVLFERLQLPAQKKTKTGYSTSADVLEKLRRKHPIVQCVLDYRMLTKLKSTYADGLLGYIAEDGRIHTTFQNTVTATGRLSSTDPNLQNIPVRTELGSELRRMFIAPAGWVLVDADYSQIELRVLSHMADDPNLQQAFLAGEDVHAVTASQVFGVPLSEVTPLMRRNAKAVNFGIVYGISEFSLAEDIGVSRNEAKAYMDAYLQKYSKVRDFMKNVVEQAKKDGYVSTIYGRRRWIPDLHSSNFNVRSGAERIALNAPVQGSAADIIKLAMIAVDRALEEAGLRARLILQVHDELIVEAPRDEADQVCRIVTEQMQKVASLKVPLTAQAKAAESWYDAK